jgi:hypothetical protein
MKLLEFTYTKADGKTSQRAVIELLSPQKHFEGIDVTQLEEAEFADFTLEMREMKDRQYAETMELLAKHDLKHNYRKFLPEQMSNVTTEHV